VVLKVNAVRLERKTRDNAYSSVAETYMYACGTRVIFILNRRRYGTRILYNVHVHRAMVVTATCVRLKLDGLYYVIYHSIHFLLRLSCLSLSPSFRVREADPFPL